MHTAQYSAPFGVRTLLPILMLIMLNGCTSVLKLSASEPINTDPSKRTLGTYIDDKQIEAIAEVNLEKTSAALKEAQVNVTVYNGVALLTGQIASSADRKKAAQVVSEIAGVRQVHNQLELLSQRNWVANSNDAWITTKVKSQLLLNRDVKSSRIKVLTENGVVYLMGHLSQAQASKAARIASAVKGAQKVVKVIEYLN